MGYISSASTVYMDFHLTEAGRNVLVTGDLSQAISKFALSDGDIDYRQPPSTGHSVTAQGGYLTDVTGVHNSCTASVNAGYTLNENTKPMLFVDVDATTNTGGGGAITTQQQQVVLGFDENGDGVQQHYSMIEVEVYLHDYMVLQKHLMQAFPSAHRLLYEGQSGGTITPAIWKSAFKDAFVNFSSTTTFNSTTLQQCLDAIKSMPGRGQFLDFYDSVHVKDGANLLDDSFRFSAQTDTLINNMSSFITQQHIMDQGILGGNGGSGPSQLDNPKPYTLQSMDEKSNQTLSKTFPFQLSFSNLAGTGKQGNGPGGLGFSTQGFGYLVLPQQTTFLQSINDNTAKYPNWSDSNFDPNINYETTNQDGSITTYALGFVPSWLIENFSTEGTLLTLTNNNLSETVSYANPVNTQNPVGSYDAVEYVIPTIRKRKNDHEYTSKNWYYPIPTPYLDGTIETVDGATNMTIPSDATNSNATLQLLSPGNYLSTWGIIQGNLEYVNEGITQSQIFGETKFKPSTMSPPFTQTNNGINQGGRYYNYLSRMLLETDKMFSQIQSTSTVGNFGGNPTQMTEITQGTNATGGTYYSGFTAGNGGYGISDRYIMTIPLEFKVFSESYPNALPATLKVQVVYSKEAVQQSIGYSALTTDAGFNTLAINDNGSSYWRPWDKIQTKYYGERWSRLSTGAATNADFTTDPSNSTMDVANGTTTGYKIFRNKIGGSPAL
jgi:hypothetical protein